MRKMNVKVVNIYFVGVTSSDQSKLSVLSRFSLRAEAHCQGGERSGTSQEALIMSASGVGFEGLTA